MNSIGTPDWENLPKPAEDGAARHLVGMRWPSVGLAATDGSVVDVSLVKGWVVIFGYPRTGRPGMENPPGWDSIAGARGCTPQSCGFRECFAELREAGIEQVFGLSTQVSEYQREAAERLHLPFVLLSDAELAVTQTLGLPTFEIEGALGGQGEMAGGARGNAVLLKRVTLMLKDGLIEHVFYPVFPPDRNALEVLEWMRGREI
jgi:peroxiredoxin